MRRSYRQSVMRTLYFIIAISLITASFALAVMQGCASKPVVFLPQKCEIEAPKRPNATGDTAADVARAYIYAEQLEHGLNFCISPQN